MDALYVVGIDYSMTCPAITIARTADEFAFPNCNCFYLSRKVPKGPLPNIEGIRIPDYSVQEERFDAISSWAIDNVLSICDPAHTQIFIEGYAMGAKGLVFDIAENTGVLKHKLFKAGFPLTLVAPTVVKKIATTKGNSTKDQMYEAFVRDTGVELMPLYMPKAGSVGSPVGDLVDSFYLCKYGFIQLKNEELGN